MRISLRLRPKSVLFLGAQLLHIILYMFIIGETVNPWLLVSSGVVCVLLYGYMFLSEFKFGPDLISPFLFYLIASIMRLGLGTIYAASVVSHGERQARQFNAGKGKCRQIVLLQGLRII